MKADRLKHGRPEPASAPMCHMECSRFKPCPITEEDPAKWQECKASYKAHLKDMKATRDAKEAKNGNA